MSSTLDTWCDNCGRKTSYNPDYVMQQMGVTEPKGWASIKFPTCRLHLCDSCLEVARKALSAVTLPRPLPRGWEGRDRHFLPEQKNKEIHRTHWVRFSDLGNDDKLSGKKGKIRAKNL